jgi:hypothetical protein
MQIKQMKTVTFDEKDSISCHTKKYPFLVIFASPFVGILDNQANT